MSVQPRVRQRSSVEWCSGRMAHLRPRGTSEPTLCGADAYGTGSGSRRTLTDAEAAERHQCKSCLKRVSDA